MHHEELHQLDPNGDVELILRSPNAPFAVWNASEDPLMQHLKACDPNHVMWIQKARKYSLRWCCNEKQASNFPSDLLNTDNPFDVDGFCKPVLYKFILSSRHLMLASSIFNKKLSGPWKESLHDPVERVRLIETTEWDSDALLILLQIIHGKNSHVPRSLDLEMLAKIATLVDYYNCHEAIQVNGDIWINGIKDDVSNKYNRELVLWMLVSWVFSKEDIFEHVTKIAIHGSIGPVPTLGLPIPQFLIETIEIQRREQMIPVATQLQKLLVSLRYGEVGCSFECSAMLLGALTKQMHIHGLLELLSDSECLGYGIKRTWITMRAIHSPSWSNYLSGATCRRHSCTLEDKIFTGECSNFGQNCKGLCLDDIRPWMYQRPSELRRRS